MSELSTTPVKCVIAGKTWKVSRVSVLDIRACAADFLLDGWQARIKRQAEQVPEKERRQFVVDQWEALPGPAELEDKARELLDPAKMPDEVAWRLLHAGLLPCHKTLTLADASTLYSDGDTAEVINAMQVIAGKAPSPAEQKSAPSRKRTSGRRK